MDGAETLDRLVSVFFPQRCLLCGEVVAYDDFWCGKCAGSGKPPYKSLGETHCGFLHSFAGSLAAIEYGGDMRKMVWRLKDKADKRILDFFAGAMLAVMSEYWGGVRFDVIVPVPSSARRMKERGFNPAERLARSMGGRAGIPCRCDLLVRHDATRAQRGLTAQERRVNAEKSYGAGNLDDGGINGKTALLVDDVFTTGSTAEACSRRLLESGAGSVYVITASGTHPHDDLLNYDLGLEL